MHDHAERPRTSACTLRATALRATSAAAALVANVAMAAEPVAHKFAQPGAAQSAPAPVTSLAQVTFSLALVLAAVFAAAWLMKRVRGFGGKHDEGAIVVLADKAVGPRERVVLLQVGPDRVLVGVANGSVRALHTVAAVAKDSNP